MDEVVSLLRILDWIRKQGGDVSQRLESTPKPPRPVGIVQSLSYFSHSLYM